MEKLRLISEHAESHIATRAQEASKALVASSWAALMAVIERPSLRAWSCDLANRTSLIFTVPVQGLAYVSETTDQAAVIFSHPVFSGGNVFPLLHGLAVIRHARRVIAKAGAEGADAFTQKIIAAVRACSPSLPDFVSNAVRVVMVESLADSTRHSRSLVSAFSVLRQAVIASWSRAVRRSALDFNYLALWAEGISFPVLYSNYPRPRHIG